MEWSNEKQRLRQIEDLLEELRDAGHEGALIVVEGKRDEEALRSLEVKGRYFRLSQPGLSLPSLAEKAGAQPREAVMMLDWDSHGSLLEKRFSELLTHFGVETNREIRRKMKPLVRKDIMDVESLPALLKRVRGEQNVYGF